MESVDPTVFWITIIMLMIVFLILAKHMIFWFIGGLVLRGLWFPKIMRADYKERIQRLENNSRRRNEIISKIQNAKSMTEIEQLNRELSNVRD